VDTVLVLEGGQNESKSNGIATLFGKEWFYEYLPPIRTKAAANQLNGAWCVEVTGLDAMSRARLTRMKKFMRRRSDFHWPRGSKSGVERRPRQCIFICTVNGSAYLKENTGGSRFWPIPCAGVDVAAIERDRDQLWAEASARFNAGEQWWLDPAEEAL
jgi:predicted P-loop ATPase